MEGALLDIGWWSLLGTATREIMLFAAAGLLVGGIDDLFVDLCYLWWAGWRRVRGVAAPLTVDALPPATARIAVLVPAWDEAQVIGAMLATATARWRETAVRIYVGAYPNDRATIDVVAGLAARDDRIRLVIGPRDGPTTKADCLNTLWHAVECDEARGGPVAAVLLHDAEDVVHPGELRVVEYYLERFDAVQLPVLPLRHDRSRWVSGTYLDEFAESHGKVLVVRQAIGAALPFAGVGCAINREMIGRIAAARGGAPFDAASLTEDYEMGLTVAAMGGRTALADVRDDSGRLVAVRAFFPATVRAAVRQKARWMTGIALAGWDRTRWGRAGDVPDHWMRMRDRRALLSVVVVLAAYTALLLWAMCSVAAWAGWYEMPDHPLLSLLILLNSLLLVWRAVWRMWFTGRLHGWREAMRALPRLLVGNFIAILSARGALDEYLRHLNGRAVRWDKTEHQFPTDAELAR